MCVSPLTISVRSVLRKDFYRTFYKVPCGVCGECLKQKRMSYLPRLEHEFKVAKWSLFFTLTYDEKHVHNHYISLFPEDEQYLISHGLRVDNSIIRIPCFSQKDFKNWFDLSRKKLYKKYPIFREYGIKFFACSEYGTNTNYTMRGHFHVVVHFYNEVPLKTKKDIFCLFVGLWSNGRTEHDNNIPFDRCLVQNPLASARYVSKYISKNIVDIDLRFKMLYKYMVELDKTNSSLRNAERLKMFRALKPKIWHSRGYGSGVFPIFDNLSDSRKYELLKRGILKSDKSGYYPISRYYLDKYLYKFHYVYFGNCTSKECLHIRTLTPFGLYYKIHHTIDLIKDQSSKIYGFFNNTISQTDSILLAFFRVFGFEFLTRKKNIFNYEVFTNWLTCSSVVSLEHSICNFVSDCFTFIYNTCCRFIVEPFNSNKVHLRKLRFVNLLQYFNLSVYYKQYDDFIMSSSLGNSAEFQNNCNVFLRHKSLTFN